MMAPYSQEGEPPAIPARFRWNSGLDKSWGQDQVTQGGSIHRTLRPRRRSGRSTAKQPMPLSSNGKAA